MKKHLTLSALLTLALATACGCFAAPGEPPTVIVCPADAPSNVKLAAKETRRYVYQRTGELLPMAESATGNIVSFKTDKSLVEQQYRLKSDGKSLAISGGSAVAVLYGAYAFAEKLGVRFYLHGDVIPSRKIPFALPLLDETRQPFFATRGIQPFHDFAEGPDWWTTDDYKAYIGQLAKMKMNFMGLHCYPESTNNPFAEPLIWHGLPEDLADDGSVKFSYPSAWITTDLPGNIWNYAGLETSEFTGGASELFPADAFGPQVMRDTGMKLPKTVEECNQVFNQAGRMMGEVVREARRLGLKVCLGTETPLTLPKALGERLVRAGKNPADPAVVQALYRGTFSWVQKNIAPDYYWLWTPEGWTWSGNTPAQAKATEDDMNAALGALKELGNPFTLATCGWVLGPQQNRAAFDQLLPKESPMGCISRNLGHDGLDAGFSAIKGRPLWAIPWVENDPNMVAYQPWAKRMLFDAADARRRGCIGLMGIHWRTKILSANLSALAQAAWDQSWAPAEFFSQQATVNLGTVGSNPALKIAGTEEAPVYQSLRWGLDAYPIEVPNGEYNVTLKFCEIAYDKPDIRVFGVKVQDQIVAEKLDLFAKVGKFHAFEMVVPKIRVSDGSLNLTFTKQADFPCLSGVEIVGVADAVNQLPARPYTRRINVGGPAWKNYEADEVVTKFAGGRNRALPAESFYHDFAKAHFGPEVAEESGKILTAVDGTLNVSQWLNGPGNLTVIHEPWAQARKPFAWVDQFAALRPRVSGKGELERYDYWLNTFRATATMIEIGCLRGAVDQAVGRMKAETNAAMKKTLAQDAVKARIELARGWECLMQIESQTVSTPGELGTIANLELRTRVFSHFVDAHDATLKAALDSPLPPETSLDRIPAANPRLMVMTVRSSVAKGEALALPIIALDKTPVKSVSVLVRPLGQGDWRSIAAKHVARAVWSVTLPAATDDFEYQVVAASSTGAKLTWPATAPEINQTVVVAP